jgi:hypothetical protein
VVERLGILLPLLQILRRERQLLQKQGCDKRGHAGLLLLVLRLWAAVLQEGQLLLEGCWEGRGCLPEALELLCDLCPQGLHHLSLHTSTNQ